MSRAAKVEAEREQVALQVKADLYSETPEATTLAGPLGEAIAEAAGSYSLEFVTPEQLAEGICAWLTNPTIWEPDGGEAS